ncbi:hypothetical protein cyc_07391 [Cyclospora cayetanensis]|uniref:Uncharacterized protein n=1 Tax=Cyclospora cayetanensis TaxID=88456 RepID=A0A1D3CVR7_9EIME|nr:hypothetical protein cyc_07391 [Cyclospora cayetanensis]
MEAVHGAQLRAVEASVRKRYVGITYSLHGNAPFVHADRIEQILALVPYYVSLCWKYPHYEVQARKRSKAPERDNYEQKLSMPEIADLFDNLDAQRQCISNWSFSNSITHEILLKFGDQ